MKTKKIYYLLCLNYLSYIQNSSPSSMRHTKGWFIFRYTLLFCLIKAAGVFFFCHCFNDIFIDINFVRS